MPKAVETTVLARINPIIVDQLCVDDDEVTPGSNFRDDLGADSLDIVELVMRLEEEFDLEIPDVDADKIKTVQDAVNYLEKRTK